MSEALLLIGILALMFYVINMVLNISNEKKGIRKGLKKEYKKIKDNRKSILTIGWFFFLIWGLNFSLDNYKDTFGNYPFVNSKIVFDKHIEQELFGEDYYLIAADGSLCQVSLGEYKVIKINETIECVWYK